MNLNQLNTLIPKRWILLLRYYLPFFKKPDPVYFKLRQFLDKELKNKEVGFFDLKLFSEFLTIINSYLSSESHHNMAKPIITSVIPNTADFIKNKTLKEIFDKFQPEDNNNYALITFLKQLPLDIFSNYLQHLCKNLNNSENRQSYYEKHITWCAELNDKFSIEDKLYLISVLPTHLIIQNKPYINTLAMHKAEDIPLYIEKLAPNLKEKVLLFYLNQSDELNIKNSLFFELLNQLFKIEPEKAYAFFSEYLTKYTTEKQLVILSQLYGAASLEENEMRFPLIENTYTKEQQSLLTDRLIQDAFDNNSTVSFLILNSIQKNLDRYQLNLFQILAIHSLLKKSITNTILENNYFINFNDLKKTMQSFSSEIQSFVIQHAINSMCAIISAIIKNIPKTTEKYSLHTRWHHFINDNWIDPHKSKLQQLEKVIEKIPDSIEEKHQADLNFLKELYQLLDPEIQSLKAIERERCKKQAIDAEIKQEERRELAKLGIMGTTFFNEESEEAYKTATCEKKSLRAF